MSLDWANERYVRVYTRDTPDMMLWPWESRAIWPLLVRKADRSGLIPTKHGLRALAVLIAIPIEVVTAGVAGLLEDGCLREVSGGGYLIPNYIEAQETPASDAKRQRDLRERRRAGASGEEHSTGNEPSRDVTQPHAASRDVTPNRTVPFRSEPSRSEPEREPSPSAPATPQSPPALALVPVEPKAKTKRKAPLPADWRPKADHAAIAREEGKDLEFELAKMRDWDASAGKGSKDWDASFRNFLRRKDFGGGARGSPSPPRDPRVGYSPARPDSHTTPDGIVRTLTEL